MFIRHNHILRSIHTKKLRRVKRSQGWIRDGTNTSSFPTHLFCKSLKIISRCLLLDAIIESGSPEDSTKRPKLALILRTARLTNMTPPIASGATQNIATIAFGVLATLIGAFSLWQGRRAWRRLYRQLRERPAESDHRSRDYTHVDWSFCALTNPHQKPPGLSNLKHVTYMNFQHRRSREVHRQLPLDEPSQTRRDFSILSRLLRQP